MPPFVCFPSFPFVAPTLAPQILRTLLRTQLVFACPSAVWSSMDLIHTPPCAKQLRLRECRKNIARQLLIAQSGVETFNDPVLPRRAWLDVQRVGSALLAPLFDHLRNEVAFIVAASYYWRASIAVNSSSTIITSCDFNLRETSGAICSRVYSSNTTNILIGIPLLVRSKRIQTSHFALVRRLIANNAGLRGSNSFKRFTASRSADPYSVHHRCNVIKDTSSDFATSSTIFPRVSASSASLNFATISSGL